jgi:hypothetical protein
MRRGNRVKDPARWMSEGISLLFNSRWGGREGEFGNRHKACYVGACPCRPTRDQSRNKHADVASGSQHGNDGGIIWGSYAMVSELLNCTARDPGRSSAGRAVADSFGSEGWMEEVAPMPKSNLVLDVCAEVG